MQPQGHVQALVRMLSYHQQPQAACDAPRWKVNVGMSVDVEPEMPAEVTAALIARGHKIESQDDSYMDFGSAQFIWKTEHGYIAASDPRRDGQAVGY
jgi:gamma-glutamyltranspeptidase/glutathione hydrolase